MQLPYQDKNRQTGDKTIQHRFGQELRNPTKSRYACGEEYNSHNQDKCKSVLLVYGWINVRSACDYPCCHKNRGHR